MNRSAEHRLGSLDEIACRLAEAVLAAPIVWFMAREQVQKEQGAFHEPERL